MSALYTSALTSGTFADGSGSWLASGRNSNLDRVLAEQLGEPGQAELELGSSLAAGAVAVDLIGAP